MLLAHGVPQDVSAVLRAVTGSFRAWGASATVTRTVAEGDTLEFAGRSWNVHLRPGHSPSDTVFHDAERGLLVGGDHLIGHISSNALVSRPLDGSAPEHRPQPLVTYMASLEQTRAMDLQLVLPGHGDPVKGHARLIGERFRMHERRARKIGKLVAERPMSAYEIAQTLWGNVAVTQAFLTLSEVLGHVDILINEGSVAEHCGDDGVVRFQPA
jgi:glyoxylase-like metal-dependent hydrolase (beta-lactamase superfamily II)